MTAVVYAHKAGRGNGVGLHYSRFRPSWRFIIPPNQRLGLMPPAQNRHFPPRIREVGLTTATPLPNRSFGPKGPTPSFENTNGLSGTLFRGRDTIGRHLMIDVVEQVIERHQEVKNEGISEDRARYPVVSISTG